MKDEQFQSAYENYLAFLKKEIPEPEDEMLIKEFAEILTEETIQAVKILARRNI